MTILSVNPDLTVQTLLSYGSDGGGVGQFSRPKGVCLLPDPDSADHLLVYVADYGNSRIVKLSVDMESQQVHWVSERGFFGSVLTDVTAGLGGSVYAVDWANNCVMALAGDLSSLVYRYAGCNFVHPIALTGCGDEVAVCERWTDTSGIQYLRIVPDIDSLSGGGMFDATTDSAYVEFGLSDAVAHVSIDVPGSDVHIVRDTLLKPGPRYGFYWNGRDDQGRLVLPGVYDLRVKARYRISEDNPALISETCVVCTVKGMTVAGPESGPWTMAMDPIVPTGEVTIARAESLVIEPGVRVMPVGNSGISLEGRLCAQGTSEAPIRFTPYRKLLPVADSASAGRWQGIRVQNYAEASCSLDHCVIEYAGSPVNGDSGAVVSRREGALSLTNSVIRHSASRGVWADPSSHDNRLMFLQGDTFEDVHGYPASVLAESVHSVVHSCVFRNNATPALDVWAGDGHEIAQSAEWLKAEPGWHYDVDGQLRVRKPVDNSVCSLTVAPGVAVRFARGSRLTLGSTSLRKGCLVAKGGVEGVSFVAQDSMVPDNRWYGIDLNSGSECELENCRVAYTKDDNLHLGQDCQASLQNCTFFQSGDCGVHVTGSSPSMVGCRFENAFTGVKVEGSSSPTIQGCTFAGNQSYGLYAASDQQVLPTNCTFRQNAVPARIRANLVAPLVEMNTFTSNTFRGIEVGLGNGMGRIQDLARWRATPEIYQYQCKGDVDVWREAEDGSGRAQNAEAERRAQKPENQIHDSPSPEGRLTANSSQPTARTQISDSPSPLPSPRWGEGEEARLKIEDCRLKSEESKTSDSPSPLPSPRWGIRVNLRS